MENWDGIVAHQTELSLFHGDFTQQFCTAAQSGNTCSWLTNNEHWPFVTSEECGYLPNCNCPPALSTRINKTANRVASRYISDDNFETVQYTIDLTIERSDLVADTGADSVKFKTMTVNVYDLTIPADGGSLWNRAGITSNSGSWEWHDVCEEGKVGGCFRREFDETELADLNNTPLDLQIQYTMNTGLQIDTDTAKVANVAFATVTASYDEYFLQQDGTYAIKPSDNSVCYSKNGGVGSDARFGNLKQDILDSMATGGVGALNTSSLGSTWVVKIIRPYIEARSGANVAIASNEKLTGQQGDTTGQVFVGEDAEPLADLNNALESTTNPLASYKENVDEDTISTFFGTDWVTTPDDAGVYFLANPDTTTVTLSNTNLPASPRTFVIDGADVLINEDFEPETLHAFIIRSGGNVQIAPSVKKIRGLFIVEDGQILSGTGAIPADKQLEVRGALMGDATDLLTHRTWIGDRSNPIDPEFKMEPSIRILFDLDILDATPPAIEGYLGSDWSQQ